MKKIKLKMSKAVYLGLFILDVSKTLMYNFGMIILNQSMVKMQHFVIWIQIVLLLILRLKIFMKILQIILKKRFDT